MNRTAYINKLIAEPVSGLDIEKMSFAVIDRETMHSYPEDQWEIVRRMIHATGDIGLSNEVYVSKDAVRSGVRALWEGRPIYTDSNMIRAGLSMARLRQANAAYSHEQVHCHVADADVAEAAAAAGLPRSLFAVRKAASVFQGGIALFGNAPVGLLELNRMILEDGVRPALVMAMPVGFVHVIESKEEFLSLGIPYVAVLGRRGGSALAVSALHALCTLAR
ncbi:MAG: precorrin-8X methylmutase [Acidobacteriota bacterium]|jgi:precorrin isomerase|nr:precorrin-8X methylmutase [Acidobacteriota bacterium]